MFDDSVADFWKDKLVHLMHRNMVRTDGERLTMGSVPLVFEDFAKKYPEYPALTNITNSYATWEISFTSDLKFRLFIQGQIKGTILQKQGNDYVKLCDARFPNNPFPEIESFLEMLPEYLKMLDVQNIQNLQNSRQMKVCRHFIVALLEEKFGGTDIVWQLEENGQNFNLKLIKGKEEKTVSLNQTDFSEKILSVSL